MEEGKEEGKVYMAMLIMPVKCIYIYIHFIGIINMAIYTSQTKLV